MIRLVALKAFNQYGLRVAAGETFDAREITSAALIYQKLADYAPESAGRPKAPKPKPKRKKTSQDPDRRRYNRADLEASE